jgi:hypothetical protein
VLALAFFVGGQLMLVTTIVPIVRRLGLGEEPMRAVGRRFGLGSLVALGVLLATGAAMASHFERWEDTVLHAKLLLLVVIGVLTALHVVTPYSRAVSVAVFLASLATLWFGVVLSH